MAEETAYLLRYHEIALKGDNRRWFEERLAINARRLLKRELENEDFRLERVRGRLILTGSFAPQEAGRALSRLFGLSSFSLARETPTDLEEIGRIASEEIGRAQQSGARTFAVRARRSDKTLARSSMEIERELGARILAAYPRLKVDLGSPEAQVNVEIRHDRSYVWCEKKPGLGGMPVGTNGSFLALLSGGIDSPVAALRALRRGARVSFVHFDGAPFVGEEALRKAEDLSRAVNEYQPLPRPLFVIPFGKIQERVANASDPRLRTVLYRRLMIRISASIARANRLDALLTGESLGQVASQTMENILTVDSVSEIPVFRPLIAFDKEEIIAEAKRFGTYSISIRQAGDCCTLFADRNPALRCSPSQAEEAERAIPIREWVEEAVASAWRAR